MRAGRPPTQPRAAAADARRRPSRWPPSTSPPARRHPDPDHRHRPGTCADRPPLGRSALSTGDPPCSARPTSAPSSPWPSPSRCVALVAVAGFEVVDAKAEVDEATVAGRAGRGSLGPGSLVVHLQNERNRAAIDLIGLGAAAELAVEDNPEARELHRPRGRGVRRRRPTAAAASCSEAFEPAWAAFEDLDEPPRRRRRLRRPDGQHQRRVRRRGVPALHDHHRGLLRRHLAGRPERRRRRRSATAPRSSTPPPARARCGPASCATSCRPPSPARLDDPAVRQEVAALFDRGQRLRRHHPHQRQRPLRRRGRRDLRRGGRAELQPADRELPRRRRRGDRPAARRPSPPIPTIGYTGLRDQGRRPARRRGRPPRRTRPSPGSSSSWASPSAACVLALLVTWLASRSITRPLRSLKRQAEEMADTRLPGRRPPDPRHPGRRGRRDPRGRADHGEDQGRGQPGGRRAVEGAVERRRPRRRAGRAPPQHLRLVHQPRPPQPEPAQPPARLHHRPRAQRDRPRHPRGPVPPRPPRHPHAPQRRVAARAGRHRAAPPVVGAGEGRRRRAGRPRRGRGLPAGASCATSSRPPSPVRSPPTSPTCSPSSSRTACRSRRPTSRSR